jgi:methylenetetrahydrofolate dehydrogenase (NADP+)/methenyltetrahydrofolate cyclohydrolase
MTSNKNNVFDGKKLASQILDDIKKELVDKSLKLAVVFAGNNTSSALFIKNKQKACEKVGIKIGVHLVSSTNIIKKIKQLNESDVSGIIVQLPLPESIDTSDVLKTIDPKKDVDCLTPENMGHLFSEKEKILPCTPAGILEILKHEKIRLKGKNVVIVNHSVIVGKPLALMLLNRNATVSICHEFTKNLGAFTKNADIVISATGVPNLIKADMIKENAIVIDAGIKISEKILGDVDFENVKDIASLITPVPGGVGPMTVAMVIRNTYLLYKNSLL